MRTIVALIFLMTPAFAHSWYEDTLSPSGSSCCGGNDCVQVDKARVEQKVDGYILDGKWFFRDPEDVLPSKDNNYHACIRSGTPKCFFVPGDQV